MTSQEQTLLEQVHQTVVTMAGDIGEMKGRLEGRDVVCKIHRDDIHDNTVAIEALKEERRNARFVTAITSAIVSGLTLGIGWLIMIFTGRTP